MTSKRTVTENFIVTVLSICFCSKIWWYYYLRLLLSIYIWYIPLLNGNSGSIHFLCHSDCKFTLMYSCVLRLHVRDLKVKLGYILIIKKVEGYMSLRNRKGKEGSFCMSRSCNSSRKNINPKYLHGIKRPLFLMYIKVWKLKV